MEKTDFSQDPPDVQAEALVDLKRILGPKATVQYTRGTAVDRRGKEYTTITLGQGQQAVTFSQAAFVPSVIRDVFPDKEGVVPVAAIRYRFQQGREMIPPSEVESAPAGYVPPSDRVERAPKGYLPAGSEGGKDAGDKDTVSPSFDETIRNALEKARTNPPIIGDAHDDVRPPRPGTPGGGPETSGAAMKDGSAKKGRKF